ncbi:hypothetical protein OBBRIDRAFT_888148 [Obba rivulosa]|uniref:Uncharacterized protein n=1 Tax=Obba rivulosa TaxID=1052685 RepID=A0A8E2DNH2_9APHY|nr:hypothetical protein OBBRIDRAFT_888148 [Obba rivulosa]
MSPSRSTRSSSSISIITAKSGRLSPRRQDTGNDDIVIAVMGPEKTGKPEFMKHFSSLPATLEPTAVEVWLSTRFLLDGRWVKLVHVPGFDEPDPLGRDAETLRDLASFLVSEYHAGRRLSGIIYTYNISDTRFDPHALRHRTMFQKICGRKVFRNVVIASTGRDRVDVNTAARRDEQYERLHFKPLLDEGASMHDYNGKLESAQAIIRRLLHNQPKSLHIQSELAEQEKSLADTEAGQEVVREMCATMARREDQIILDRKEIDQVLLSAQDVDKIAVAMLETDIQRKQSDIVRLQDARSMMLEFRAPAIVEGTDQPYFGMPLSPANDLESRPPAPAPVDAPSSSSSRRSHLRGMFNLRLFRASGDCSASE